MPAWSAEDQATTAKRLQEIVAQLNALDQWFTQAEQQRAVWLVELQKQDRAIARIGGEVTTLRTAIAATDKELRGLERRLATLAEQLDQQATYIAQHVSAAYRLRGQDFLKQLLNQESPDKLDRMVRYHRYFSASRLEVLGEYQTTAAALRSTEEDLLSTRQRDSEQRATLEKEQAGLSTERRNRATMLAELDTETESKTEEYERLQKDRNRLEQLLAELRRKASVLDGSDFREARGALPMPVTGRIRHAFGARRADGRLRWHGIDIDAPHGAPVTAVFRGRVVFADWLRGFGFLTVVDHGSDYMTLYGHVDVLHKKAGDWVESGELIASAGNSGGMPQPGLYFEVRHKGQPKDPISWINRN